MKLKNQCVCHLKLNRDEIKKQGRSRKEDISREGITMIEGLLTFFVTILFNCICSAIYDGVHMKVRVVMGVIGR